MKRPTTRYILLAAYTALLTLPSLTAAEVQEQPGEHPAFLAARGRITFERYCSHCHGKEADGTGSAGKFLKVPPADLRLYHQSYEKFPAEMIYDIIEGRKTVPGHGSKDMPIWGDVFRDPLLMEQGARADESPEVREKRKIRELVFFIKSIQRSKASPGDS